MPLEISDVTKTYAMAAAAVLSITLVPVLMGYFIRGRIPAESANPLSRFLIWAYRPLLTRVLAAPGATLVVAVLAVLSLLLPVYGIGGLLEPVKWPLLLLRPAAPAAASRTWSATARSARPAVSATMTAGP